MEKSPPQLPLPAYIIGLFLTWRLLLFTGFGLGFFLIPQFRPSFPYAHERLLPRGEPTLWTWGNFDGVHYLQIIEYGYVDEYTQALFPLYPLISRIISSTFHLDPLLAGLIVSHLCFLAALYFLSRLALLLELEQKSLPRLLWYLVLFPTSFFFGAVYTESLFLLLSVLCFYFAFRKEWWLTGLAGALATATRFTGIFLFPSVLILWWQQSHAIKQSRHPELGSELAPDLIRGSPVLKILDQVRNDIKLGNILSKVKSLPSLTSAKEGISVFRQSFPLQLLLIPSGLLAYMLYLQITTNDPLYFIHAQPHFFSHRTISKLIILPQVFWRYLKMLVTVSPSSTIYFPLVLESLTGSIFLILSLLTFRRFGLALGLYTLATYLLPTLTGSFSSLPRFVLVLFPCFIILAELAERHFSIKWLYQTLAPILLIFSLVYFTRGFWIA
jgi:hypothetical protein